MATLIAGKTECCICRKLILNPNEAGAFAPFVSNEADPLFAFNDAVFHHQCLEQHPLGQLAIARYREFEIENSLERRFCIVCGQQITDPDDFFAIGHVTDDASHPLRQWNYAKLHKSCLHRWQGRTDVLRYFEANRGAGKCYGRGIDYVIKTLQKF